MLPYYEMWKIIFAKVTIKDFWFHIFSKTWPFPIRRWSLFPWSLKLRKLVTLPINRESYSVRFLRCGYKKKCSSGPLSLSLSPLTLRTQPPMKLGSHEEVSQVGVLAMAPVGFSAQLEQSLQLWESESSSGSPPLRAFCMKVQTFEAETSHTRKNTDKWISIFNCC